MKNDRRWPPCLRAERIGSDRLQEQQAVAPLCAGVMCCWVRVSQHDHRPGGAHRCCRCALGRRRNTAWPHVLAVGRLRGAGTISAQGMKYAFSGSRPTQTDDPNRWFRGKGNQSFPSGEVTEITTAITPFVLEYGREYRRSGRSSCCLSTTRSRASRSVHTGNRTCWRFLRWVRPSVPTTTRARHRCRSVSCLAG